MADLTLTNIATLTGSCNGVVTALDSTAVVTQVVDGLTVKKSADKEIWAGGPLTYTITITNTAEYVLDNPVITDKLDTSIAALIGGSVTINDAAAPNYTYDTATGLLKIQLPPVGVNDIVVVRFQVRRSENGPR